VTAIFVSGHRPNSILGGFVVDEATGPVEETEPAELVASSDTTIFNLDGVPGRSG
jgi:hypothetical protein